MPEIRHFVSPEGAREVVICTGEETAVIVTYTDYTVTRKTIPIDRVVDRIYGMREWFEQ